MTETKLKRRWFRFSIRELLLVIAVVALAVGWWLDHQELANQKKAQSVAYYLKYANAADVCEMLQRRFFGDDVAVIVGPTEDAVFVRAPAKHQADIKDRISKLDAPPCPNGNDSPCDFALPSATCLSAQP